MAETKQKTQSINSEIINGWKILIGSFTYNTAVLINTSIDLTSRLQRGDKLRLKQGGAYKYFYVIAIGASTIGIDGRGRYTLTNAGITDIYVSKENSPAGFPADWGYTPSGLDQSWAFGEVFDGTVIHAMPGSTNVDFLNLTVSTYATAYVMIWVGTEILQGVGTLGNYKSYAVLNGGATLKDNVVLGGGTLTVTPSTAGGVTKFTLQTNGNVTNSNIVLRYKVIGSRDVIVKEL